MWRVLRTLRLVLAVILSLVLVDSLSGLFYRTNTAVSVVRTGPTTGAVHTLLVFPGYAADCHSISDAFRRNLDSQWKMVVVCYPERGIDDTQIFMALRGDIESAAPGQVSILAGSMGGMVAVTFLERLRQSDPAMLAEVSLFLDTSPADRTLIKVPPGALWLSHWYRGGVLSSLVWYITDGSPDRPTLEPGASLETVEMGDTFNREIGMPALTSQAQYIDDFRLANLTSYSGIVGSATFIEANSPDLDPMVWVAESVSEWRGQMPELRVRTLESRVGNWHIPWTQRPEEVLDVVLHP